LEVLPFLDLERGDAGSPAGYCSAVRSLDDNGDSSSPSGLQARYQAGARGGALNQCFSHGFKRIEITQVLLYVG
jgi:hypothetical protein